MTIVWTALAFVARLGATWLATELIRNFISGLAFGLIEVRFTRQLPALARPAVGALSRDMCTAAHLRGARVSVPLSLAASVIARVVFWSRGSFDALTFWSPIALGVLVGTPIGILAFKRALRARFAGATVRGAGVAATAGSANAGASPEWTEAIIRHATGSAALRQKIERAVTAWDRLEDLAGGVSVTFHELLRDPGVVKRRQPDGAAVLERTSARSSVERQFDALLAEIAEEVARLEGKRSRVAECQASLFHDFFTIAERLGM